MSKMLSEEQIVELRPGTKLFIADIEVADWVGEIDVEIQETSYEPGKCLHWQACFLTEEDAQAFVRNVASRFVASATKLLNFGCK